MHVEGDVHQSGAEGRRSGERAYAMKKSLIIIFCSSSLRRLVVAGAFYVEAADGTATIDLPSFSTDFALKIKPQEQ